ncbi:MAG: HD domain-containing phosphohydrolase [Eubacterium sp.]|nr:HD domain-containing phosphohydrolase [Eubacterium sp.]
MQDSGLILIDLSDLLYALSFAIDAVEEQILGVEREHGKRVAYLCMRMMKTQGLSNAELLDQVAAFLLHDNALGGDYREEIGQYFSFAQSCNLTLPEDAAADFHWTVGEHNFRTLPLRTKPWNIVLYHHENADGTGPLGKTEGETNLASEALHLVDFLDAGLKLNTYSPDKYEKIQEFIRRFRGKLFSKRACDLFLSVVTPDLLEHMAVIGPEKCLRQELPSVTDTYTEEEVRSISRFFSFIVDHRSSFTRRHSQSVADIAEIMARSYGWDHDKVIRYYFAGSLHDIGKLIISNDILEKPGKLTTGEFAEMKHHAEASLFVLKRIKGLEDNVAEWAANHHEKLDGTGYSRGLNADQLTFEDRLMAVVDIYVALRERRPYKEGMTHEETMQIIRRQAELGKLDAGITEDFDKIEAVRSYFE